MLLGQLQLLLRDLDQVRERGLSAAFGVMTNRDILGALGGDARLMLSRRFCASKTTDDEYKLVSLFEWMRVRLDKPGAFPLERIFSQLEAGACLKGILDQIDPAQHQTVIDILGDLMQRGLLSLVTDDGGEAQAHSEQLRFFANFRPLFEAPPASNGELNDGTADAARPFRRTRFDSRPRKAWIAPGDGSCSCRHRPHHW